MAVDGNVAKKRRTNNSKGRKQKEDRLSSLPDDILIRILSLLPFQLAIVCGSLSRRWRGLWTNLTSIHFRYPSEFCASFDTIMEQITSPFIHTFDIDLAQPVNHPKWQRYLNSWLRKLCDRNVREIKLAWSEFWVWNEVPWFIFQIQSLVSLELNSSFPIQFSQPVCDRFNLPNLKKLILNCRPLPCKRLEKLIQACPSLEELSLNRVFDRGSRRSFKCSNQNLRRLFLDLGLDCNKVVINAPKLEYIDVRTPASTKYFFDEELSLLREAKIEITDRDHDLSHKKNCLMSTIYGAVSNVECLTLDVFALHYLSAVFRNATRVTLNMKMSHDIKIVLPLLELCPVVDVLTLQFWDIGNGNSIPNKIAHVGSLRRVLKRIEIETYWKTDDEPTKSFLELVEYLLNNSLNLEHFRLSVGGCEDKAMGRELKLCKLLYQCPMVSKGCEVEFVGTFLNMSRKACPKVWKANGEVIPFS